MGEAKYIYFTCLKCKATSSWHKPDQQWRLRPCAFRFSDGSFCFRHCWSFCSPLRLALTPSSTLGTSGTLGAPLLGSPNLVSRRRKSRPILVPPRVAVTAAPLHLPYLVVRILVVRTLVDMVVRTLVDMVVPTLVDMVVPTLVVLTLAALTLAPLTALTALTAHTALTALTALIALTALTLVVLTLVAIIFDIN